MEVWCRRAAAHASRTRPYAAAVSSSPPKGKLYSSANLAARRGVLRGPLPPLITGGRRRCSGFGNAGESTTPKYLPLNEKGPPSRTSHRPVLTPRCPPDQAQRPPQGR